MTVLPHLKIKKMINLDTDQLLKDMLSAAKTSLTHHWEKAEINATEEFKKFTSKLAQIAEKKVAGDLSEEKARLLLEIQIDSMKIELLTIQGLTILATEAAINAAIDVVRGNVNRSLGWNVL
jgi:hypothetical protein